MENSTSAQERVFGERFRTTLVCVDEGRAGELSGRLSNPYLGDDTPFSGTLDLLGQMEKLLDQMQLPQAFTTLRGFVRTAFPEAEAPPEPRPQVGAAATFAVRVLFRQNASWQGSVTWIEGKQEESFRSVLELLLLKKSALDQPAKRKQA
jgi:hypothetical protein